MQDSNELALALTRICEAEGIATTQVRSFQIDDGEIIARIERPDGRGRIVIYPIALLADHRKASALKVSSPDDRPPLAK